MKRIVFIGAAGSGKSSLAASVFADLKQQGAVAEHVDEFVRRDIQVNGPMRSIWEQYRTRQFQKELEDAVPSTVDYVICDSGTLTPYFYAVLYADPADARQRLVLQDMYKYLLDDLYLKRYDLVVYLPALAGVTLNDGTRYQSDEQIKVLDQHMRLTFTQIHRVSNIVTLDTDFAQRLPTIMPLILGANSLTEHGRTDTMHSSLRDSIENYSVECGPLLAGL